MNKLFKLTVLILGISLSSQVFAELILSPSGQPSLANNEQMIRIADMSDDKLAYISYLDSRSIYKNEKNDKILNYTSYWQYKTPQSTQVQGKILLSYLDVIQTKVDCNNKKIMLLGAVSHDKEGEMVNWQIEKNPTWIKVAPKSYAEFEMNFACKFAGY